MIYLRTDIFFLELIKQRESFWFVTVELRDYIQSCTELIAAQSFIKHVLIYLLDYLGGVILNVLAHFHDAFAFALFLALDLHFIEDLFEFWLLHELLVG